MAKRGGDKLRLWTNFPKTSKGGDNFLLISGGEISFSTTCPRQVLGKKFWDFEKGGGKNRKSCSKIKKGVEKIVVDRGPNGEGKFFGNF